MGSASLALIQKKIHLKWTYKHIWWVTLNIDIKEYIQNGLVSGVLPPHVTARGGGAFMTAYKVSLSLTRNGWKKNT